MRSIPVCAGFPARLQSQLGAVMVGPHHNRMCNDSAKARYDGSALVVHIDALLPDTARDLADDVFAMLYAPMRAA